MGVEVCVNRHMGKSSLWPGVGWQGSVTASRVAKVGVIMCACSGVWSACVCVFMGVCVLVVCIYMSVYA